MRVSSDKMDRVRKDGNPKPAFCEASNPIFEYAARGQHHEKRMEWASAVHWYQRALACLPNLFGFDKAIRPPDPAYQQDISFHPHHASRIYAALGEVLKAAGRPGDSVLAFRAAAALDPQNRKAVDPAKISRDYGQSESAHEDQANDGHDPAGKGTRLALRDSVTLIMATHCASPLKRFESLSPPSNKLVTATYGSMLRVFGEEIAACPKIMCYDSHPNGSGRDARYAKAIEHFSLQNGFALRSFPGVGLFNVFNRIIQCIQTPYIFFAEHDWMFKGGRIMLPDLIQVMDAEPRINAIRFNKRENYLNGQDFLMTVDSIQRRFPLMGTSSFSNNPSILRTDKVKNEWLPVCEKALFRVANQLGGSAFGIEEILFKKYVQDIRAQGFHKAHAKWGTYVYGKVGDKPRIIHLGE